MRQANARVIMPGAYRHDTELGPLFLDHSLDDFTVNHIVLAMAKRKLTPFDIIGAEIIEGEVYFELREPLSSD